MAEAREIPSAIKARLLEWYTEEEARLWWTTQQPLLDDTCPCTASDADCLRLLDQLDSGVYL